jgi:hypothetical protein
LWAYSNAFGWYAVDPEECQYDRAQVDTLQALAEAAGYEITMWLEP